jgi:zinc D-Ala-D-Ala carboxypeptidase
MLGIAQEFYNLYLGPSLTSHSEGQVMELSEHFTLEEMVASDTAAKGGIDNTPSPEIVEELKATTALLEKIRAILGVPMQVTSGYRCPALNTAVGGVADSAHLFGQAADFVAPTFGSPLQICLALKPQAAALNFDQLIRESTWVHIGRRTGTQRQELWTIVPGTTHRGIP